MAEALATAFVRIRPDSAGFEGEMRRDISRAGPGIAKEGKRQGGLFGSTFAKATAVFAGAALFKLGRDSVREFGEAEKAQGRLSDAFARFPKLADTNIGALRDLNSQLALKTKFDDDALASGQAIIAQFGLTGKQVAGITPLIADYAAKTGKDIPTAAKTIGKAFLGNTRALKELGINYKLTGDETKDMAAIQDLLRQKVGGFAEKEGKTAAGQAAILSNQWGEMQEKVGARLVPALTKLAEIGIKVIGFLERNSSVLIPLVGTIAVIVGGIKLWTVAQTALNVVLSLNPIGLVVVAIAGLIAGLVLAYKKSETFRNIVNGAFNAVKTVALAVFNAVKAAAVAVFEWIKKNWPLLLAILTGPIGAAVILIIRNWDKIKSGAKAVKEFVVEKFQAIADFIKGLPQRIGNIGSKIWGSIKSGAEHAINFVVGIINTIIDKINGLINAFNRIPGVPDVGNVPHLGYVGDRSQPYSVTHLQHGGLVKRRPGGVLAVLGEGRFDEVVTPLDRTRRSPYETQQPATWTGSGESGDTFQVIAPMQEQVHAMERLLQRRKLARMRVAT